MNFLQVAGVGKKQQGTDTVTNVSFLQHQFQKSAIVGETGSGKSTLLKMIAGLVQPDSGDVFFQDERVAGPLQKLLPGHSKIAYLSQHFELRNNYRVEEELNYLNELSYEDADALFSVCRIQHLLKRKTTEISGGEKQRISLARLLLSSPKLLLLDEPYSNLDFIHKNILKKVVKDVSEKLAITCLLISHDPTDILSWADDIMVMKDGAVIQQGTPEDIYYRPVNEYAAALFGSYNLLGQALYNAFTNGVVEQSEKQMFLRPEQFIINSLQTKFIKGQAHEVRFLGSAYEVDVRFDNDEMITVKTGLKTLHKGDTVRVSLASNPLHFI